MLAEDGGAVRVLSVSEAGANVSLTGSRARVEVTLTAVPESISRLRLLAWSEAQTRLLVPADARVSVDGTPRFAVPLDAKSQLLRAAEILELYRRHGTWKVRAVASGWEHHVPAMARGVGVPESAFSAGAAPAATPATRPAPRYRRAHTGPSPRVGPPLLRDLLDSIVGPARAPAITRSWTSSCTACSCASACNSRRTSCRSSRSRRLAAGS